MLGREDVDRRRSVIERELLLRRVWRDFFGRRAFVKNDLKADCFRPGLSADILCVNGMEESWCLSEDFIEI